MGRARVRLETIRPVGGPGESRWRPPWRCVPPVCSEPLGVEPLGRGDRYAVPAAAVPGNPLYSNATGIVRAAEAMPDDGVSGGLNLVGWGFNLPAWETGKKLDRLRGLVTGP